jgi:ketosteroid isomerase-like protein
MDRMYNRNHVTMLVNRSIVYEYFRLIKNKDINRLLYLFADDATIFEPFSKIHGGLQGKNTIKAFLEVVLMATDRLQHEIQFEQQGIDKYDSCNDNKVTAFVTFAMGGRLKAKFTFELSKENYNSQKLKKIQSLYIQFIE